jgi:hypothetical protein
MGNLCLLHTRHFPALLYKLFMLNDFSITNTLFVLAAVSSKLSYIDFNFFRFNVLFHCSSFLGAFAKLRKATISFAMSVLLSVCPHGTRLPLEGFSWIFFIWESFENLPRKLKFTLKRTRKTGTLHENQYTILIISRSVLYGMWNVVYKIKTYFMFNNFLSKILPYIR